MRGREFPVDCFRRICSLKTSNRSRWLLKFKNFHCYRSNFKSEARRTLLERRRNKNFSTSPQKWFFFLLKFFSLSEADPKQKAINKKEKAAKNLQEEKLQKIYFLFITFFSCVSQSPISLFFSPKNPFSRLDRGKKKEIGRTNENPHSIQEWDSVKEFSSEERTCFHLPGSASSLRFRSGRQQLTGMPSRNIFSLAFVLFSKDVETKGKQESSDSSFWVAKLTASVCVCVALHKERNGISVEAHIGFCCWDSFDRSSLEDAKICTVVVFKRDLEGSAKQF